MDVRISVKNVIQFISSVQDVCDIRRKCLDQLWLQEYNSYINEWKQNQIEQRKLIEKQTSENNVKGEDLEQLAELALADSLLRKARNIRSKNQKAINGVIEYKNTPATSAACCVPTLKVSAQTSEKAKTKKQIPQSKSDYAISRHKNTVLPRSKSATSGTLVAKEDRKSGQNKKKSSPLLAKCSAVNHIKSSEKTLEDQTIISSKDLDVLKRFHVSLSSHHKNKPSEYRTVLDSTENSLQHQISPHPYAREFLSHMKDKIKAASSHFKLKLWYPFLSSKNEVFFSSVKCDTVCSMKKVCAILYTIQEIMMWMDLLYMIETEICPKLVFDLKDSNKLRVCKYIQSIFNTNGQRIPMFDPNS